MWPICWMILSQDLALVANREVQSIFIGGGTPSLFSAQAIASLLTGIKHRIPVSAQAEITLEANPGTLETGKFSAFAQAGINRISIGVQSFNQQQLQALGRIHNPSQAINAAEFARQAKLTSFNLDLMHGLPQQNTMQGLADLSQALDLAPPHISWYQLTIEPNTQFFSRPPTLPDDEILWQIQQQGNDLLASAGYQQYEISAYCQPGAECQHNLNYWRFGDYLGIGCGAHGKITQVAKQQIVRTTKIKHPKGYMDLTRDYIDEQRVVPKQDLIFEFFMNRFRLVEACPQADFTQLTGLTDKASPHDILAKAQDKGLVINSQAHWQVTALGRRYLNTLLEMLV